MVKFLKFVLFIIVIAFAFALGVKFSDSFKGSMGNLREDEVKIETEMDKAFNDIKKEVRDDIPAETAHPLTDEEKNEVNSTSDTMPEYVDIEIVEPMDGVIDNTQIKTTNQNVENSNTQDGNAAPADNTVPAQPAQVPVQPAQAPAQPVPAPAPVAPASAPVAPVPAPVVQQPSPAPANQNAQPVPAQAKQPTNTPAKK